jgi:isopenicillin-N epimerase
VRTRCHDLARRAATELGLESLVPDTRDDLYGQMVSLRLPEGAPADLKERLYDEYRIEIPVMDCNGSRLIRASFQGYNDERDLEQLRSALSELL